MLPMLHLSPCVGDRYLRLMRYTGLYYSFILLCHTALSQGAQKKKVVVNIRKVTRVPVFYTQGNILCLFY